MENTLQKIATLLKSHGVQYRIVTHLPEARCIEVSKLRGNKPHQAAKALVFESKKGDSYVLAIVAGDAAADTKKLGAALGLTRLSFAPKEKVLALTGCEIGTVGMFSFDEKLKLVVDKAYVDLNQDNEIVGGLGTWDSSIFLSMKDYLRVASPLIVDFSK